MEIKETKDIKIVGLKIETSMHDSAAMIPKLWEQFIPRISEINNNLSTDVCYGYCVMKNKDDFSYYAASGVSDDSKMPEGMESDTIPGKKYAVFQHKGKLETLNDTYQNIPTELHKANLKDVGPWFELYDERYKHDEDDSEFDIYVGIEEAE